MKFTNEGNENESNEQTYNNIEKRVEKYFNEYIIPTYQLNQCVRVCPTPVVSIEKIFELFVEDELWNELRFYELMQLQMLSF